MKKWVLYMYSKNMATFEVFCYIEYKPYISELWWCMYDKVYLVYYI